MSLHSEQSSGRGTAGPQRIPARRLTYQHTTITDRGSRTMTIAAINDDLETATVVTPHPARPRPKTGRAAKILTPRAQATQGTLAGPATGRTGQRPEGHAPTVGTCPRSPPEPGRDNDQQPTTRHQPRGAALGAGFHLHAYATRLVGTRPRQATTAHPGSPS